MVAFNWSHARAGRAETQLELCQAGRGKSRERQQTDSKLFSVLCQQGGGVPSLLPHLQTRERTTNMLFVSNIETFSVMRMTCFQIKMVKRRVFCWWNNVVNIMETIRHRVIPRQVE